MPRPAPRFRNYVGHKETVDFLRRQLAGALARKEPFPHSLFLGPSGVGKTRLSTALATEYGTTLVQAMGNDERPSLSRKLAGLATGDLLLIDECHRLRPLEQELLCEAIDLNSIPSGDRNRADLAEEGKRIPLQPWTLILATDQPGVLLDALRKRMVIEVSLEYYPIDELKVITESMAAELNLLLTPQAAKLVAEIAGGLPRKAKQLLQNLRYYHPASECNQLGQKHVREFLTALGVDKNGLSGIERRYMQFVLEMGSASAESIALALGTDTEFVRRQVEPNLVRRRLVKITSSGRKVTALGEKLMLGTAATSPSPPAGEEELP